MKRPKVIAVPEPVLVEDLFRPAPEGQLEGIRRRQEERDRFILTIILELAAVGPFYSGDVWESWCRRKHPGLRRRTGLHHVRRALEGMEEMGELQSCLVLPSEHGESQTVRRYYEAVEGGPCDPGREAS
jgi:hypothetical protein